MFDWQAIGTHAVELLVGGVGTWVFQNLREAKKDLNAAFQKIRELENRLDDYEEDL